MSQSRKILVRKDPDELTRTAGDHFASIASRSVGERGRFSVALSGGSTPRSLYTHLAEHPDRDNLDWTKVDFFFGDERNVAQNSTESNFRMAKETLLDPLRVALENVHVWPTSNGAPERIANAYALELEKCLGGRPRFDLMLLGLGSDGHTASLFPNSPALHERERLAVENWVEKLADYRFTLTFPVINHAANVIFLVSGRDKADAVAKVIEGDFRPDDFPAQFVIPEDGQLFWLLDEAAASLLRDRENLHFRPAET